MKTYLNILILTAAVCLFATKPVHAQDPRLAQYFASPMTINPAFIGKGVNDWRLLSNYRSQWQGQGAQPFTTATVSLEKNLSGNKEKNILAVGMMLLSDASNGGLLKNNYLSAGIAYHNALDAEGKHFLGGGLTVNYANRLLDASKFQFQSQFGNNGFQSSLPSNDGVIIPKRSYIDVNAGLSYSFHGDNTGFYTGIGYHHAARPKDGAFANTAFKIEPRLSIQAGYSLNTDNNVGELAISSVWEQQGNFQQLTSGVLYKLGISESQLNLRSANFGVWYRFGNTIYPYVGLESDNWLFGFSYDIMTAKMASTSLQSFEFSFGWQFGTGRKNSSKKLPIIMY
jgi:type IX secretion system PorP/SprF family membrane protein